MAVKPTDSAREGAGERTSVPTGASDQALPLAGEKARSLRPEMEIARKPLRRKGLHLGAVRVVGRQQRLRLGG